MVPGECVRVGNVWRENDECKDVFCGRVKELAADGRGRAGERSGAGPSPGETHRLMIKWRSSELKRFVSSGQHRVPFLSITTSEKLVGQIPPRFSSRVSSLIRPKSELTLWRRTP